jgi:hypothetical protein
MCDALSTNVSNAKKIKTRLLLKEFSGTVWKALKGATGARSKSSPTFYKR